LVLRLGGADFALSDAAAVGPVFLRTQQSDPHFAPGVQSHLALIDFAVDEHGLEAQFLESLLAAQVPIVCCDTDFIASSWLCRVCC